MFVFPCSCCSLEEAEPARWQEFHCSPGALCGVRGMRGTLHSPGPCGGRKGGRKGGRREEGKERRERKGKEKERQRKERQGKERQDPMSVLLSPSATARISLWRFSSSPSSLPIPNPTALLCLFSMGIRRAHTVPGQAQLQAAGTFPALFSPAFPAVPDLLLSPQFPLLAQGVSMSCPQ